MNQDCEYSRGDDCRWCWDFVRLLYKVGVHALGKRIHVARLVYSRRVNAINAYIITPHIAPDVVYNNYLLSGSIHGAVDARAETREFTVEGLHDIVFL